MQAKIAGEKKVFLYVKTSFNGTKAVSAKKKKKSCEPFEVKICCANKGIQVIITEKKNECNEGELNKYLEKQRFLYKQVTS